MMSNNEYTTTASATSTTTPPRRGCETVRMVGVPTTQELVRLPDKTCSGFSGLKYECSNSTGSKSGTPNECRCGPAEKGGEKVRNCLLQE